MYTSWPPKGADSLLGTDVPHISFLPSALGGDDVVFDRGGRHGVRERSRRAVRRDLPARRERVDPQRSLVTAGDYEWGTRDGRRSGHDSESSHVVIAAAKRLADWPHRAQVPHSYFFSGTGEADWRPVY